MVKYWVSGAQHREIERASSKDHKLRTPKEEESQIIRVPLVISATPMAETEEAAKLMSASVVAPWAYRDELQPEEAAWAPTRLDVLTAGI
jgi:hypothetical protein